MFSKEDYIKYFTELEDVLKKNVYIYTDLLNEISDQSVRSKVYSIAVEEIDAFKGIKEFKQKFV